MMEYGPECSVLKKFTKKAESELLSRTAAIANRDRHVEKFRCIKLQHNGFSLKYIV